MTHLIEKAEKELAKAKADLAGIVEERDQMHSIIHQFVDRITELTHRIKELEEEVSKKSLY